MASLRRWPSGARRSSADIAVVPNGYGAVQRGSSWGRAVRVGQSRIGDAWEARSNGDNPKHYLRVRLDDPSLSEPISAALSPSKSGGTAQLVWSRRRPVDS
ncbi:MAG: DUF736 family protein [Stellaceae bacterium]